MAAAIGLSINEYEDITPWELSVYADAYADRQRQMAYLQALTVRAMVMSGLNGKRAPSYEAMFGNPKSGNDQMDDDALFQAMLTAHMALGGETTFTGKGVK